MAPLPKDTPPTFDQTVYDGSFYDHRPTSTSYAATRILELVREQLPRFGSVIDFGCGIGVWLKCAQELNATEVQGVDGAWVQPQMLQIPIENFTPWDLNTPFRTKRKFDLAMSLEAAEHLFPGSAVTFVETLCAASDFVLFSAAVPGQEGKNHFNEQWPDYWAALFAEQGYRVVDSLRGPLWQDNAIPFWYRQNVILFVKESELARLRQRPQQHPLSIVHPLIFEERYRKTLSVRETWKLFRRAVKRALKRYLGLRG